MATGDASGTWGTVTNTNLELIGEALGFGTRAIANASTDNITIADGASDSDRAMYLKLTGGGQACTVTLLPNTVSKLWFMENGTNSALTFTQGSGANVIIPAGDTKLIASNGGGSGAIVYDVFASLSVVDLKVEDDLTVTDDASVGGDLLVSGEVQTANIGFTDGDNAMTIADGGAVTFPQAPVFTSGFSAPAGVTITTADNTDQLVLKSTDADANVGPVLRLNRDSGSPADSDLLGSIIWQGDNDAGEATEVGQMFVQFDDVSNGAEDGSIYIKTRTNGSLVSRLGLYASTTCINDDGADIDFRVEGSSVTDVIFVNAGDNNLHIGTGADLITNTAGTSNTRIGVNAGNSIASGGNYNVVVGDEAGTALTTGDGNVAIGFEALKTEDANGQNIAIGYRALKNQDGGAEVANTAIGYLAGSNIDLGRENVLVGANVGDSLTHADYNVAIGNGSLSADTLGHKSTAVGYATLNAQNFTSSTDTHNTAVGYFAGVAVSTGVGNTLIGSLAGDALTTGGANTAVGNEALTTSQDGAGAVAVGYRALFDMTSGARNVGLGEQAGRGITTGNDNLAMGQQSFYAACTGSANIGLGYRSFFSATSAASNVGIGYQSLNDATTPSENTAVGYRSLPHVSTGDSNIGIGYATGDGVRGAALTTGASNILIGRQCDVAASDNSFSGVIGVHLTGKGSSTGFFSFNDGSIFQGNNNANWTTTSDRRIKKNIVDNKVGLDAINQIQVRNFEYRTEDEITEVPSHAAINKEGIQLGVIAQEIQNVLPDTVTEESTGVLSVNPDNLTWYLVNAIQQLSAKNDELEARIKKLEEG